MKMFKRVSPLVMATIMLAPSVLIQDAYAADRETRPTRPTRPTQPTGPSDGRVGGDHQNTSTVVELKKFDNYFSSYIGNLSFKLEDDREVKSVQQQFDGQHSAYLQANKVLKEKQAALTAAQKKQSDIQGEITKIEKAIVAALTEKTNIEKQIPTLRKQLQNLNQQAQVAQKAFDATKSDLQGINQNIAQAQKELKEKQDACTAAPTPECQQEVKQAQIKVAQAQKPKPAAQRLFNIAKNDLEQKQAKATEKQKEIQQKNQKVAQLEKENTQRATTLNQKNQAAKAANQEVKVAQNALKPAQNDHTNKLQARNRTATGLNNLKERIVIRVLRLNKIGAEVGGEAGSVDGDYYAEYLGFPKGQTDGDRDGREAGTSAGQANSYNQGMAQGEVEGRSQAQIDGFDHGKEEGTKAGHIAIATQRGQQDGIQRAQNSDASQVGTRQGTAAGLERAVSTGKKNGTQKGENQAIKKNESDAHGNTTVQGQFAGAFAAQTPSYPGFNCVYRGPNRYSRDQYDWRRYNDWNGDQSLCPNFKPRQHSDMARAERAILKEAFLDGYLIRYRGARREQFVRSIDHYYSPAYNQARNAAYADYSTRTYPEQLESGRQKGYLTAYNGTYPSVKERYYQEFYNSSFKNPDTANTHYASTYRRVESNNYSSMYEEIRANAYTGQEQRTFDQNIAAQTEKFRKIRFDQVEKIYTTTAVLKYVGTHIHDAGINGIAKNDGIFQPGETIVHDVTIKNFGAQAASGVQIKIDGKTFSIPTLAAKSSVTVKGAATSQVNTKLGNDHQTTLQVFSPLSAEASIQGRHYYATSSNRLNFGDKKTVAVKYPITLAGLRTKSELLINKKNVLQLSASNISNRKYTGKLDIELSADAQTNIITKSFAAINGLSGSVTLNDAQVLVASERDVYTPLNFTAKIKKQGVTIGVLPGTFRTMAKAPYSERAGKPVILVNSDKSSEDLIKVVASYGGLSQVSVLDTTLNSLNAQVYSRGLDKKSVLVLDDTRGSTVKDFGRLLKTLEDSSVVFVDYSQRGLSQALAGASELKHAAKLPNLIDGFSSPVNLYYTNNFIDGTADMNVVAQANFENYKKMVQSLANFNFTKNEIIPASGNVLTKSNYKKTNSKVRTMISMAAGEVVNASLAYKASGDNGKLVDYIKSDAPIYKRILEQSGKKVKDSTLSKNLAAIAMWKVLDKAVDSFDPMDDNVDYDIESPFEDAMKDMMQGEGIRIFSKGTWNYLKKYDKGLYETVDENPFVHSPFKL